VKNYNKKITSTIASAPPHIGEVEVTILLRTNITFGINRNIFGSPFVENGVGLGGHEKKRNTVDTEIVNLKPEGGTRRNTKNTTSPSSG